MEELYLFKVTSLSQIKADTHSLAISPGGCAPALTLDCLKTYQRSRARSDERGEVREKEVCAHIETQHMFRYK